MKQYRNADERMAEPLVLASRQATGFCQTVRGLRVLSPNPLRIFVKIQVSGVVVVCAIRRSTTIDGMTSRKLSRNMKVV